MPDFLSKLGQAAGPQFESPVMPRSVRLFRSSVPGPDTAGIKLFIEYDDMAAYGARTEFENRNVEWRRLFETQADSPEKLLSVELHTELEP
jgi:hypothetical protein